MVTVQCKKCNTTIEVEDGKNVAVCKSCGAMQVVAIPKPKARIKETAQQLTEEEQKSLAKKRENLAKQRKRIAAASKYISHSNNYFCHFTTPITFLHVCMFFAVQLTPLKQKCAHV